MAAERTAEEREVFVNCPFDEEYRSVFHAIVFTLHMCGFEPHSALEADNAVETRFEKIVRIIHACRLSVHDISRTESNAEGLPRFNMPLELGLFLGAAKYGDVGQRRKVALILDRERHRYQRYISDIAGQDIRAHGGQPEHAIREVRKWLAAQEGAALLPGGEAIIKRYASFRRSLPRLLSRVRLHEHEMQFRDLNAIVTSWLADKRIANPK